ncbi:unnamed protein product [Rotaria sp. Silwood1]|nr:unnamed protein product [Rotaria sp. Silwood1]
MLSSDETNAYVPLLLLYEKQIKLFDFLISNKKKYASWIKCVFNDYCKEYLPDLYAKLKHLGIAACISLSWFLTLFVCVMPFESALYIMDIFFFDGIKVLFQLALTILNENRQHLLECQDDGDAIMILTTYLDQFNNHKYENNEEKKIIYLIKKSYTNYNGVNVQNASSSFI